MNGTYASDMETSSTSTAQIDNIFELQNSRRVLINEPHKEWAEEVKNRLNKLAKLKTGWDGYSGAPVSFVNANFALRMLEAVCQIDAPSPQIVPGTGGDLQIEWHTEHADIELHVLGPYEVHAWRATAMTGEDGEEVNLTRDFTIITQWIRELAEPSSASGSAAA